MTGWQIFKHSALLVLRNWKQALQIGLLPIGIIILLTFAVVGTLTSGIVTGSSSPDELAEIASGGIGIVLLWIVGLFLILTVFVNWHRFVLLEEYPKGWFPPFRFGLALGYFGRILLLTLIALVVMIPVVFVGAFLGTAGAAGQAIFALLALVVGIMLGILFYRVAPILPAGAIGKPLKLRDAWEATEGTMGTIVVLVVILFGFSILVQIVVTLITLIIAPLGVLLSFAGSLVTGLINVSVLTTFYGVYIERRGID